MQRSFRWKGFWLVCAAALLVRGLVFAVNLHRDEPVILQQDSWEYIDGGHSLSQGDGFVDAQGRALGWWPPGYASFLALVFATGLASPFSLAGAVTAQVVMSSMVVGMAYLVAGWLGGVAAAIATGAMMAIEPSSVAYSNLIMSETLFTASLLGMTLLWRLWWKRADIRSLLLLAAYVGLLPLIRPVAIYLPFFLALMIGLSGAGGRPRLRTALTFLIVSLIAPVAWMARNHFVLGVPGLASVGEYELARFAHHVEKSIGQKERLSSEKEPWEDGFQIEHGYSPAQTTRARSRYFLKTVTSHPIATTRLLVTSTTMLLGVPDSRLPLILMSEAPAYEGGSIRGRLVWLPQLGVLGVLLALGMAMSLGGVLAVPVLAVRARRWPAARRWLLVLVVAATFVHMIMSSTVIWTAERYRVPVMPFLCVLLSVAVFGDGREGERAAP